MEEAFSHEATAPSSTDNTACKQSHNDEPTSSKQTPMMVKEPNVIAKMNLGMLNKENKPPKRDRKQVGQLKNSASRKSYWLQVQH